MQMHVWVIAVKWSGEYWGIESARAWETKREAQTAMKRHPFFGRLKRGHMKVVKLSQPNASLTLAGKEG